MTKPPKDRFSLHRPAAKFAALVLGKDLRQRRISQQVASLSHHSVFVRVGLSYEVGFGIVQNSFCDGWDYVSRPREGSANDARLFHEFFLGRLAIEQTRVAVGDAAKQAIEKAIQLALSGFDHQWKVAELSEVASTRYSRLTVATVTLHAAHWLDFAEIGRLNGAHL